MADDDIFDEEPEDQPARRRPGGAEGVRIVGAEEARAAYEEGRVTPRKSPDEPRPGDRPEAPPLPPAPPAARFPLADDDAPDLGRRLFHDADEGDAFDDLASRGDDEVEPRVGGRLFGESPARTAASTPGPRPEPPPPADDTPTGSIDLPHWTEPPTGQVPRITARSAADEPTGPQPRYRDVDSDWEDDDDGGVGHLADDGGDDEAVLPTRGGIAGPRPEEDDDEAFERQVEERRRMARPGRADVPSPAPPVPPTPPPTAPPAAGRPAASAPPGRPGPGRPPVPGRPRPVGRPPGEGMLEPGMPEPTPLAPKGDERDLTKAIVTGVAMGVAALLLFSWGRGPAAWLVAIVAAMATAEVYAALRARGYRPATPVGLAGTAGLVLAGYDRGFEAFPLVMALVAVTTFVWFLIRAEDARPTVNIAMTFLPFLYVGTLAGFGGLLLAFPNGVGMLLGVIITAVVYDVFGYAVGSQVGTRRVAPAISPNKTVEGLIAGMVGSLLAGLIIVRMIHPWDIGSALWLGLLVGLSAPLGDFLESMLKRDMGIKDFSSLIPGHGGVMDRFDAILLSLPVAFYLVRVLDLF